MHDVINVIHVSNWMYLFFVISALASLAIFAMVVRRIFKRTTNFKFNVISYLLFMFITSAAVQSYTMITQFDIYPQHVKFVEIDFSSYYLEVLESSTMNAIRKTAMQHGGSCVNNVCTMPVLSFEHNAHEAWVKLGKESDDKLYCYCHSSINYEFGKNTFGAKINFISNLKNN